MVLSSILRGIEYCHNEHNICHGNLRPENILFKRPDSDAEMKVTSRLIVDDENSTLVLLPGCCGRCCFEKKHGIALDHPLLAEEMLHGLTVRKTTHSQRKTCCAHVFESLAFQN